MTGTALDLDALRTRAWATVDLDAIAHNVRAILGRLPAAASYMAVVKADGYGHGAVPVAQAALEAGATWLGVATAEEALDLRAAGVGAPMLILGPVPARHLRPVVDAQCAVTIADPSHLEALQRASDALVPRVHVKVDTGMMRLGIDPEGLAAVLAAAARQRVIVEGVFTHLACADDPDPAFTRAQLAVFEDAVRRVRARYPGAIAHASASAGAIAHPEAAFDMVRIGIALYGIAPAPHLVEPPLRAAMTLSSRVIRVRHAPAGAAVSYGATYRTPAGTTIATVAIGYADGYPRSLSNRGCMVVRGCRVPVAGRVCMDYTMLDGGGGDVHEGDEIVVFGDALPAAEVADAAGTIAYELLCRVGRRVPRIYTRSGRPVTVAVPEATMRAVQAGGVAAASSTGIP